MRTVRRGIAIGVIGIGCAIGLGSAGATSAATTCVPEEIDVGDYTSDGDVDLEGYLAAVAAANAVCAPTSGGNLPSTGGSSSSILIAGTVLLAAGTGGVVLSRRRTSETV